MKLNQLLGYAGLISIRHPLRLIDVGNCIIAPYVRNIFKDKRLSCGWFWSDFNVTAARPPPPTSRPAGNAAID